MITSFQWGKLTKSIVYFEFSQMFEVLPLLHYIVTGHLVASYKIKHENYSYCTPITKMWFSGMHLS